MDSRVTKVAAHAVPGQPSSVMSITHQKPVIIRRMSDPRDKNMSLGLFCLACDRWGEVVPQEWLDDGKPDLNYVEQRFKCSECGGRATKQVRPKPIDFSRGAMTAGSTR